MQEPRSHTPFHGSPLRMVQAPTVSFLIYACILLFATVMLAFELYMAGHASTTPTILLHTTQHTNVHSLIPHHIAEGPPDLPIAEGPPDIPAGFPA